MISKFCQGEVLDTLRHGEGKHTCSNGDTYDGSWRFDKRQGHGTAEFARGLKYQGQWHEDLAQGCDILSNSAGFQASAAARGRIATQDLQNVPAFCSVGQEARRRARIGRSGCRSQPRPFVGN